MATDGRKINRSVVFVVGLFLGGLIVSFYDEESAKKFERYFEELWLS